MCPEHQSVDVILAVAGAGYTSTDTPRPCPARSTLHRDMTPLGGVTGGISSGRNELVTVVTVAADQLRVLTVHQAISLSVPLGRPWFSRVRHSTATFTK
ncbi:hypothetical protein EFW17_04955 [Halostreptopolyspora alba]|uniref:Uncharacterized protein n=1 Tax=Halostreptopolyspora alba TaxID=2487137 RepID=A0A3N0EFK7_9ACTN|nr:hypothetical protein EFW17_04955 [Nocardiopsaceae bacterium YIM 96095]